MPTGEMLRRHFRALAAAHPRGVYVDFWDAWQNNNGYITGSPDHWAGFGADAAEGTVVVPGNNNPMSDTDPANTVGPPIADPAVDPGPLPTMPWLDNTGGYQLARKATVVRPGGQPNGEFLVSGCFRFDHLAHSRIGGSAKYPVVIGYGGGTHDKNFNSAGVWLYVTGSRGNLNLGQLMFGGITVGGGGGGQAITPLNDFEWTHVGSPQGTPDINIGETVVFVVDNWKLAYRTSSMPALTWRELTHPNPGDLLMNVGNPNKYQDFTLGTVEPPTRQRTPMSIACGLGLQSQGQDMFDVVKDLWDSWGV